MWLRCWQWRTLGRVCLLRGQVHCGIRLQMSPDLERRFCSSPSMETEGPEDPKRITTTPRVLIWSAQTMGYSPRQMLWSVFLRHALPDILTGLRIALGF